MTATGTSTAGTVIGRRRGSSAPPASRAIPARRGPPPIPVPSRSTSRTCWSGSMPATTSTSQDRKSTRLNSSHVAISYAVFCLKKKKIRKTSHGQDDGQDRRAEAYRRTLEQHDQLKRHRKGPEQHQGKATSSDESSICAIHRGR